MKTHTRIRCKDAFIDTTNYFGTGDETQEQLKQDLPVILQAALRTAKEEVNKMLANGTNTHTFQFECPPLPSGQNVKGNLMTLFVESIEQEEEACDKPNNPLAEVYPSLFPYYSTNNPVKSISKLTPFQYSNDNFWTTVGEMAGVNNEVGDIEPQEGTTQKEETFTHYIGYEDTLGKIAKKYATTPEILAELNSMKSINSIIRVGDSLQIPLSTLPANVQPPTKPEKRKFSTNGNYVVQPNDTVFGIAKEHGIDVEDIIKWNNFDRSNLGLYKGESIYLYKQEKKNNVDDVSENNYRQFQLPVWEKDNTNLAGTQIYHKELIDIEGILNSKNGKRYPQGKRFQKGDVNNISSHNDNNKDFFPDVTPNPVLLDPVAGVLPLTPLYLGYREIIGIDNNLRKRYADFSTAFLTGTMLEKKAARNEAKMLLNNFVNGKGKTLHFDFNSEMSRLLSEDEDFIRYASEVEIEAMKYYATNKTIDGFNKIFHQIRSPYIKDTWFMHTVMGGVQQIDITIKTVSANHIELSYRVYDRFGAGTDDARSSLPGLASLYWLQHNSYKYYPETENQYMPFIWSVDVSRREVNSILQLQ